MTTHNNTQLKSILIVDDEPANIQLLGNMLTAENYTVEFAMNGEEALTWLKSRTFDLVLLDILMPDMSGFEVCRTIRRNQRLQDLPVIFLSALNEMEDKVTAFDVGGNDYVTKPFQSKEVISRIKTHLKLKESLEIANQAVKEKEKSNLLLNTILQSIPETLITVDNELNLLNINRKENPICDLNQHDKSELQKILKNHRSPYCQVILKTLESKKSIKDFQVQVTNPDGVKKSVQLSTSPLIDQNSVFDGVLLVVRDVSRLFELESKLHERQSFRNIIGKSDSMQEIYSLLEQISDVETNILISGDSGTGKELIAEALHYGSNRASQPLVRVNCAALSENLLESELFGHVKGAFTGATENRVGRFQTAHKGTIFLDEIGDISPQVQAKLLRVLEQKEFERLGESKTIKVDVRVVAASNVNFKEKIAEKEFREDLYYRLKGMVVTLPPLRKRAEDIPLLCRHFLNIFKESLNKKIEGLSDPVMELFLNYPWPGNIRELRHAMEHACILCTESKIALNHLPDEIREYKSQDNQDSPFAYEPKINEKTLRETLEKSRWNKVKAAKSLGIGRNTLYRYMKKYGINND